MSNTTLNMNDQIELLSVPLPEDVLKHKWHGDFAAMERIIDRRLHSEIEDVMRRRLLLEKCIMKKLPRNYPYTMEQAVELFQDRNGLAALTPEHVSKDINEIAGRNYTVPPANEFHIHILYTQKRPVIKPDHIGMAVMPVGNIKLLWHSSSLSRRSG